MTSNASCLSTLVNANHLNEKLKCCQVVVYFWIYLFPKKSKLGHLEHFCQAGEMKNVAWGNMNRFGIGLVDVYVDISPGKKVF